MNETILNKATELGKLIADSDVKKRADEANKALLADAEAAGLIQDYNTKREAKMAEFEGKQPSEDEIKEVGDFLQAEFNKMAQNKIIREYIEANKAFETLLSQMNGILQHFINGEAEGGCGGSCSTCGGCH